MRVGVTVYNTLKAGGTEKRGEKTKVFNRGGGKLGQGVGALKMGRWNPFMNHGRHFSGRWHT